MITREADYAIRMLVYLTDHPGAPTFEVAQAMDVPYRFLRKLVTRMVAAGLIRSQRGRGGGLCLVRPAARVSLQQVLDSMAPEGTVFIPCARNPRLCGRARTCKAHRVFSRLQQRVRKELGQVTLRDLSG